MNPSVEPALTARPGNTTGAPRRTVLGAKPFPRRLSDRPGRFLHRIGRAKRRGRGGSRSGQELLNSGGRIDGVEECAVVAEEAADHGVGLAVTREERVIAARAVQ